MGIFDNVGSEQADLEALDNFTKAINKVDTVAAATAAKRAKLQKQEDLYKQQQLDKMDSVEKSGIGEAYNKVVSGLSNVADMGIQSALFAPGLAIQNLRIDPTEQEYFNKQVKHTKLVNALNAALKYKRNPNVNAYIKNLQEAVKKTELTPGENRILNINEGMFGQTPAEIISNRDSVQKISNNVSDFLSGPTIDTTDMDAAAATAAPFFDSIIDPALEDSHKDFSKANDAGLSVEGAKQALFGLGNLTLAGVAGLGAIVRAAKEHPKGAFDTALVSGPASVAAAINPEALIAATALSNQNRDIQQFRKNHDNAQPSLTDQLKIAGSAGLQAVLDVGADRVALAPVLTAAEKVQRAKKLKKLIEARKKGKSREAFKENKLNKANASTHTLKGDVAHTLAAIPESVLTEAGAEGVIEALRQYSTDSKPDGKKIFENVIMGGLGGLATTTSLQTVTDAPSLAVHTIKSTPVGARKVAKGISDIASKIANTDRGKKIKNNLSKASKQVVDTAKTASENIQSKNNPLHEIDSILSDESIANRSSTQDHKDKTVHQLNDAFKNLRTSRKEAIDKITDPEKLAAFQKEDIKLLGQAVNKINTYKQSISNTKEETDNDIADVVQAEESTPEVQDKVQRVYNSIKTNPDSISVKQAEQLSKSKALSTKQKKQIRLFANTSKAIGSLRNEVSKIQRKSIDQVHSEVVDGGGKKPGIREFISRIHDALSNDDTTDANSVLAALAKFTNAHQNKTKKFKQAFALARAPKSNKNAKKLEALNKELTSKYGSEDRPVDIHKGSGNLISILNRESAALKAALNEAKNLVDSAQVPEEGFGLNDNVESTIQEKPSEEPTKEAENTKAEEPKTKDTKIEEPKPKDTKAEDAKAEKSIANEPKAEEPSKKEENVKETPSVENASTIEQSTNNVDPREEAINSIKEAVQGKDISTLKGETKKTAQAVLDGKAPKSKLTVAQLGRIHKKITKLPVAEKQETESKPQNEEDKVTEAPVENNKKKDIPKKPNKSNEKSVDNFADIGELLNEDTSNTKEDIVLNTDEDVTQQTEETEPKHEIKNNKEYNLSNELMDSPIQDGWVKTLFTSTNEKGNNKNPLQFIPDFFSQLVDQNRSKELTDFLHSLNESERESLRDLTKFVRTFIRKFNQDIYNQRESFLTSDLVQYFAKKDGTLPENLIAAIAIEAYNFLDSSSRQEFAPNSVINAMLSRDKKQKVTRYAREQLTHGGHGKMLLADILGSNIRKMLRIAVNPVNNIGSNVLPDLHSSLGLYAIHTMDALGLIQITSFDRAESERLLNEEFGDKKDEYKGRIKNRALLTIINPIIPIADKIKDVTKEHGNTAKKLFGAHHYTQFPSFKPPTSVSNVIKGTFQKVPKFVQEALLAHSKNPNTIVKGHHEVFNSLTREQQEEAVGVNKDIENTVLIDDRDAAKAKNQDLIRDVDNYYEFIDSMEGDLSKPFYYNFTVIKTFRSFINSNGINPLNSKVHRHLVGNPNWVSRIDTENERQQFFLGVAEALGIKTVGRDIATYIAEVKELIKTPEIANAIEAIKFQKSHEPTDESKQNIAIGIKAGKKNLLSLAGLVAMADYKANEAFDTTLTREADGINNGVAIGTMQLLTSNGEGNTTDFADLEARLNRVGMFTDKSSENDMETWRKGIGNYDTYEDAAIPWEDTVLGILAHATKPLEDSQKENNRQAAEKVSIETFQKSPTATKFVNKFLKNYSNAAGRIRSLYGIIGSFTTTEDGVTAVNSLARKLVKYPLMVFNYGSGIPSIIKGLSGEFVDSIKEDVTTAINNNDTARLQFLSKHLSIVLNKPINLLSENPIDFSFKPYETELARIIGGTYGAALSATLESKFGDFIRKRTLANNAMNLAFEIFNTVYTTRVKRAQDSKIAKGIADAEKRLGRPLTKEETLKYGQRLTQFRLDSIAKELYDIMPLFRHIFSEGFEDSNVAMKYGKERDDTREHGASIKFKNYTIHGSKSSTVGGTHRIFRAPGVSALIGGIQGLDAANIYSIISRHRVLSTHDAITTGIKDFYEATNSLNEAMNDNMINYSYFDEVNTTLKRVLKEIEKYSKQDNVDYLQHVKLLLNRKDGFSLQNYQIGEDFQTYNSINAFLKDFNAAHEAIVRDKIELDASYTVSGNYDAVGQRGNYQTTHFKELVDDVEQDFNNPDQFDKTVKDMLAEVSEELNRTYQSSPEAIDIDSFKSTEPDSEVKPEDALHTFHDMGKRDVQLGNVLSNEHQQHLISLLRSLIVKNMQPIILKLRKQGVFNYGVTTIDKVYINQASSTVNDGSVMTMQETFVHELVHHIIAHLDDRENYEVKKEFESLYNSVKELITTKYGKGKEHELFLEDPATATDAQIESAKNSWDHMFNSPEVTTQTKVDPITGQVVKTYFNNQLSEFITMGLTNEKLSNLLSELTIKPVKAKTKLDSAKSILVKLYNKLLDIFLVRASNSKNIAADAELMRLVNNLVDVNERHKDLVYKGFNFNQGMNTAATKALTFAIVKPLTVIINTASGQKVSKTVQTLGNTAKFATQTSYKGFRKALFKVFDRLGMAEQSMIRGLYTEIEVNNPDIRAYDNKQRVSNMILDNARNQTKSAIKEYLTNAFDNITKEESNSITAAGLMTNIQHLFTEDFSNWSDVLQNMTNRAKSFKNINSAKAQLIKKYGSRVGNYFFKHAVSLGQQMATGDHSEHNGMFNATSIINFAGVHPLDRPKRSISDPDAAIKLIDDIATLTAIRHTDPKHVKAFADLINKEFSKDPIDNGVAVSLRLHRDLMEQTLARNFNGQAGLVRTGFIKDIFGKTVDTKIATEEEGEALIKRGYVKLHELSRDPTIDPGKPLFVYKSNTSQKIAWNSGGMSLISNKSAGINLVDIFTKQGSHSAFMDAVTMHQQIEAKKRAIVRRQFSSSKTADATNKLDIIIDGDFNVTGYRYLPNNKTKDELLNRNLSFEEVMSGMAADIKVKTATESINNEFIGLMHEDFIENGAKNSTEFVTIGPKADTQERRDYYNMLPDEAKQEIKRVWGTHSMYVRKDAVNIVFGYRKFSLSNWAHSRVEQQTIHTKVVDRALDTFAKLIARPGATKAENVWLDVAKAVKDTIVIKTGEVFVDNVLSNNTLLWFKGLSRKEIVRDQDLGYRAIVDLVRDKRELKQLQLDIEIKRGLKDKSAIKNRIAMLKSNISSNPMEELIEQAAFSTIIEDISGLEVDDSGNRTELEELTKGITDKLPKFANTAADVLLIKHSTELYKQLKHLTEVSDLVSKFALHKYNMKNGMDKAESIQDINATFINYDRPTSKVLQYLNDVDAVMFTKYSLRILNVLKTVLVNAPSRFMALLMLEEVLNVNVPDPYDSATSVMYKVNLNPLDVMSKGLDTGTINLLEGVF